MRILMVGYVALVLSETIINRPVLPERSYNFRPFWSYSAIKTGTERFKIRYTHEHILNITMFIPIGASCWCLMRRKQWWRALVAGLVFSMCIEAMQFIFTRGFCEIDDVLHNALGAVVGFWLMAAFAAIVKAVFLRNRSKRV